MLISDCLYSGSENAIKLSTLERALKLSGRQIRQAIHRERLHGSPIISDNVNGYYLAETEKELIHFKESMLHRATEITRIANAVGSATIRKEK